MKQPILETGKIVSTHGVRGEIKILPWADEPEFLLQFKTVLIGGAEYAVASSRVQGTCVLMKLAGIDTVEQAQALREKVVSVRREDASIPEGSVFIADLIGLRVLDGEREIGTVSEVLTLPRGDVYVVKGEREILIPSVPEFILERNVDGGYIRVKLIEGM